LPGSWSDRRPEVAVVSTTAPTFASGIHIMSLWCSNPAVLPTLVSTIPVPQNFRIRIGPGATAAAFNTTTKLGLVVPHHWADHRGARRRGKSGQRSVDRS